MIIPSRIRKVALTAHITSTLSWLGAIAGFLALAIAGLWSNDVQLVRSSYLGDGIDRMLRSRSVVRSFPVNRAHYVVRHYVGIVSSLLGCDQIRDQGCLWCHIRAIRAERNSSRTAREISQIGSCKPKILNKNRRHEFCELQRGIRDPAQSNYGE